MTDEIQKLQLKITELENQLKSLSTKANVDPEEFKTFQKVSQQLGISGCINECTPTSCIISCFVCNHCYHCYKPCIIPCINECTCGPCNICTINQPGLIGGSRFGSLG